MLLTEERYRVVAVQKRGEAFRAEDRVYVDPLTGCASLHAEYAVAGEDALQKCPLVGVCNADAPREAFTVDVRIPVAEPKDLRVVQTLGTGRHTADGRQIVVPFLVNRRFHKDDRPDLDRHPVEFMLERDAAVSGQRSAVSDQRDPAVPDVAPLQEPAARSAKPWLVDTQAAVSGQRSAVSLAETPETAAPPAAVQKPAAVDRVYFREDAEDNEPAADSPPQKSAAPADAA